MKVTVTFGDTAVVVPCKPGWTVRDLVDQATRRYSRIVEQRGDSGVRIQRLEYTEGGILDMDDLLGDLVEDRDKLVAVFDRVQLSRTDSPRDNISNYSSAAPSPEPFHYHPHLLSQEPMTGEIEVNEASLKANTPLLVRSSSDSAIAPPYEIRDTPTPENQRNGSPEREVNYVLRGALDRLQADDRPAKMSKFNFSSLTRSVEIAGNQGPLGIHVVPYCSSLSGRTLGLHIKSIEESSRSKKESIFQEDECIVQINATPLEDKTFAHSQDVFRQAMGSPSVRLEVLPVSHKLRYEKSLIGQLFTNDAKDPTARTKSPMVPRAKPKPTQPDPKAETRPVNQVEVRQPDTSAKTSDIPMGVTAAAAAEELQSRQDSTPSPSSRPASSSMASRSPVPPGLANLTNKKSGKRIKIELKKGVEGLGFTVVTRDSSIHGPGPILVKNILPRGAAVKDGRLQPGDRILEVNGVDMTGRSQEELVAMLRSTKHGESVCVVVARQEDIFLPRELKGEEAGGTVLEDGREQLMYEIPLNESGSAGLGVSLKGNKSRETGEDLGIFIKSIIHGGAAYKDGRLSVNDQLMSVNGESLLGRSNHAAMETLRRSMSSEGNARGTIQLVVLRSPRQLGGATSSSSPVPIPIYSNAQSTSSNQEQWVHDGYQRATMNSSPHIPFMCSDNAPYPATATNGSYGHYGNEGEDEELEQDFPPPPSPHAVEEMNRERPLTPPHHSDFPTHSTQGFYISDRDNTPRNRASKSMDMVADESNLGSLVRPKNNPSASGSLGPTLGLWKSSSLESLQTAVSEAKHSQSQAQVPFHRPRPHMVRGRGCNQSFRIAIDKSYDGPSEDDDDLSEQSSGHETVASGSSRQGLDVDVDDKKKSKGKKKEKKGKGKKKAESDDLERKTKRKGFGLLRFGRKDKSKDAAKTSKVKLDVLNEEGQGRIPDNRDGYDPRYAEFHSSNVTPDSGSFPDVEDDESDPNYARINNFRQAPSPQLFVSRTPSPSAAIATSNPHLASAEELDGLYAKVNKSRPPPLSSAQQNQHRTQVNSDHQYQGIHQDYPPARAAPVYETLDIARRQALEADPHRMAPRGVESSRPGHRYDEPDWPYQAPARRDPYDYPTHTRPVPRETEPYSNQPARVPLPQPGTQYDQHYYPSSPSPNVEQQHRTAARQDVPPSPTAGRRGRHYYEAVGGREASPARYTSPERYPVVVRERYTSPERYTYRDDRQTDPRQKNPVIGAV